MSKPEFDDIVKSNDGDWVSICDSCVKEYNFDEYYLDDFSSPEFALKDTSPICGVKECSNTAYTYFTFPADWAEQTFNGTATYKITCGDCGTTLEGDLKSYTFVYNEKGCDTCNGLAEKLFCEYQGSTNKHKPIIEYVCDAHIPIKAESKEECERLIINQINSLGLDCSIQKIFEKGVSPEENADRPD